LCEALGKHVFDHGQKAAADQMRTSWEKITEHVGTARGQDISNEPQNKSAVVIAEPVLSPAVLVRHQAREANTRASLTNLQLA
jgi:hypothetical protein